MHGKCDLSVIAQNYRNIVQIWQTWLSELLQIKRKVENKCRRLT